MIAINDHADGWLPGREGESFSVQSAHCPPPFAEVGEGIGASEGFTGRTNAHSAKVKAIHFTYLPCWGRVGEKNARWPGRFGAIHCVIRTREVRGGSM